MPPVVRSLPTPEAHELLALTRDLVEREVAPRAADGEARGEFPRELFRTLGKAGLLGLPYDEEYGGGGAAVRGLPAGARGAQPRLAGGRPRHERPHAGLLPARGVRHRRAARALAARHARRRAARRLLPVRGRQRLRRRGAADPGGARRRRLGRRRRQGLGHPRRRGRLLQPDGAHRRARRQGHLVPAGRRRRRPGLQPQAPERKMGMRSSTTATVLLEQARGARPTGCSARRGRASASR